jgi:uncharacterized protein (TIGR02117 family)
MKLIRRFFAWLAARSRPVRILVKLLLAFLLLLSPFVVYFPTAWLLGSIAVNRDFTPPSDGIEIAIWSNGVHTDFVVPVQHPAKDWRPWFPASNFEAVPSTTTHVAFGWGDKGFFLNVPAWKDLTFKVAVNALVLDGEAAMHVTLLGDIPQGGGVRRFRVSEDQYRLLVSHLVNSLRLGPDGRPIHLGAPGYHEHDTFYEATGNYGPVNTCNEWTGAGLRKAGVRTGVWTPFEPFVMKHLPDPATPSGHE